MLNKLVAFYAFSAFALFSLSITPFANSEPILEIEPNNTPSRANTIESGQLIQGALSSRRDIDVYRIVVPSESRLTVRFRPMPMPAKEEPVDQSLNPHAQPSTSSNKAASEQEPSTQSLEQAPEGISAEQGGLQDPTTDQAIEGLMAELFGAQGAFPWKWRIAADEESQAEGGFSFFFGARIDEQETTRSFGIKPGVYDIVVGPAINLSLFNHPFWSPNPYELEVAIDPASIASYDIEPNNTFLTAQRIQVGSRIEGSFQGSADIDLFKFRTERPQYVRLTFEHDQVNDSQCLFSVNLSLIEGPETFTPVESLCSTGDTALLTRTILLEPGEYLLEIAPPTQTAFRALPYRFSIDEIEVF